MDQASLLVIESQHDRSEMCAAAFGLGVAADHGFELVPDLDLQPFGAAALLINAVTPLGQDAFEALGARHFEECFALLLIMIGVADGIAGVEQRGQFFLALFERDFSPVVAIEIEQIECVIENGDIGIGGPAAAAGTESGALLHQAERCSALLIECDYFSIEDRGFRMDELWEIFEFWIALGKFILIARDQA